jgi:hypothetical protein
MLKQHLLRYSRGFATLDTELLLN